MPKRYELPDLRPRDLIRVLNPEGAESLMYIDDDGGGHWVHFSNSRELYHLTMRGWDLRDHHGNYTELGRLRDIAPSAIAQDWLTVERALRAAAPLPAFKVGDVLTKEQVAALPAGAVTQHVNEHGPYVEQWNGKGAGRCVTVDWSYLDAPAFDPWGAVHARDGFRLIALGTPLDDRRALYRALADQGFRPAVAALAGEPTPAPATKVRDQTPKAQSNAPVEVSATGTMVRVGDMVETTKKALTALPAGTVVHFWDPDEWRLTARRTSDDFRWVDLVDNNARAEPWGISRRRAVVIALACFDHDSAAKARDAFLARPFKGQEQAAALAAYLESKISVDVKATLDQVSVKVTDQTISAVSEAVRRSSLLLMQPEELDQYRAILTEGEFLTWDHHIVEPLDEPTAIEYREPMPEIKSTMKLDLKTETLSIDVPRLPGETDNAYAARAAALVKPQVNAVADNVMLQAQPSWLERAAEALKPVASELAAEAKAQTRQAIALGGVEVARAAMHKGIAAAAQAVAPKHADKVVQVVDHPITRWLENAGLFLGARAAGRPALAAVGLREVVRSPLEGAAGVLVQAASQVVGAVKGALVAADEAARVEQVTGQPEAAQVSAGEG